MKIKKLLEDLGITNIKGNPDRRIDGVASLSNTDTNKLMWCRHGNEHLLTGVSDCAIIVSEHVDVDSLQPGNTYILVDNPRFTFTRAANTLYDKYMKAEEAEPVIHQSAQIAESVYIGKNCCIGKNVTIYPHVTILCNTTVDDGATIYPNTAIGSVGFSQDRNERGEWEKFPHLGGVYIGKNVEIGSNVSIDRAGLDNTTIGEGTLIDNLVHVAHNVQIGKHCEIICLSGIGGSAKIGDNTTISLSVCIRDYITIGSNVLVGMGSVVTKDIPDNTIVAGNPAREVSELKRYLEFIRRNI